MLRIALLPISQNYKYFTELKNAEANNYLRFFRNSDSRRFASMFFLHKPSSQTQGLTFEKTVLEGLCCSVNLSSEHNVVFSHHFAKVENAVAHSAQCSVDTDAFLLSNILEGHILKIVHGQDFPLLLG